MRQHEPMALLLSWTVYQNICLGVMLLDERLVNQAYLRV